MATQTNSKWYIPNWEWSVLKSSMLEVTYLTSLAILPLFINIVMTAISHECLSYALKAKVIPFEILSYCLSFLAPSMYLLTKTSGSGYKLWGVHFFSNSTIVMYSLCLVLYLTAKNKWMEVINTDQHRVDAYFILALCFFVITIIFRIYSIYHGKRAPGYQQKRENDQINFTKQLLEAIIKQS